MYNEGVRVNLGEGTLEAPEGLVGNQELVDQGLLPLLLGEARREEFCGALLDRAHLFIQDNTPPRKANTPPPKKKRQPYSKHKHDSSCFVCFSIAFQRAEAKIKTFSVAWLSNPTHGNVVHPAYVPETLKYRYDTKCLW